VNCDKMDGDRPRLPASKNYYRLSHVSWALAQISCNCSWSPKNTQQYHNHNYHNTCLFSTICTAIITTSVMANWNEGSNYTTNDNITAMLCGTGRIKLKWGTQCPQNFGLSKNCQKILLSEIFHPNMPIFRLKPDPIWGNLGRKIKT